MKPNPPANAGPSTDCLHPVGSAPSIDQIIAADTGDSSLIANLAKRGRELETVWHQACCWLACHLTQKQVADLAQYLRSKTSEPICVKCGGWKWLFWRELDNYDGPANETGIDDTKYTCDRCHGTGREPNK